MSAKVIETARLLRDRSKRTRGALARDARGQSCSPIAPEATCWCISGAIMKAVNHDPDQAEGSPSYHEFLAVYSQVRSILGWGDNVIHLMWDDADDVDQDDAVETLLTEAGAP